MLLFGGGTRIPKVRDLILSAAKGHDQLGMSLNTDESAALGAVYQAAHLSKGFRVKKFLVKDANMYPIEVRVSAGSVSRCLPMVVRMFSYIDTASAYFFRSSSSGP